MRKQTLVLIFSILTIAVSAQKDPEAMKILSEFSKKATSAPSVTIDFTIVTSNAREGDVDTLSGSAIISGDKYQLTLPENSIWTDGKTVWSYLPDANEVTITKSDPDDESFISKPSLLFTMYREGFKVRLVEQTVNEWIIDLYPEEISTDLIRIRLKIGKKLHDLIGAEYKTKDGVTMNLTSDKYDLSFKPDDDFFTFNPADYKDVDVIDMR
ncbi:MAG: outer membrane lipoprotein carrier protein LolA [Bacteroidales bacterium]